MDFRVYVIIEMPIIDCKYELLMPIDRRIHDIIGVLVKNIPDLTKGYYNDNKPNLFNKSTGLMYDLNLIIADSNIKNGTRLVLV